MELRDYQKDCIIAVFDFIKNDTAPIVAELATGAGKSIIVASIAKEIHRLSGGKHILCLAPSAELVKQNRDKYLLTGNPASVFSASAGAKCLKHPVVFGTPQTVANALERFGSRFAMIIIDEAHGLTRSVKAIIDKIQSENKRVRVLGLTATPYRLGTGYIYQTDINNKTIPEEQAKEPYFYKLVYKVTANELIKKGFLTPPLIGEIGAGAYDTSNLQLNNMGKFNQEDIDRAFVGKGRLTSDIVADVVAQSKNRKSVMFFASTVEHAHEVLESLPKELSAIITSETPKKDRDRIISQFSSNKIKYLVNVAVLTTGFDAPIVDVIALLRATESAGLLQQIIGRGLRLYEGKENVLLLDYAQNIERHFPDGDIFSPVIAVKGGGGGAIIEQECPECKHINNFTLRKNKEGYKINKEGYFTDLLGNVIKTDEGYPLPAHYGRRCQGRINITRNVEDWVQCTHRWSFKVCEKCSEENDITARKCKKCKNELIDPNAKLVFEFKKLKSDPTRVQIDEVVNYTYRKTMSLKGNECIKVDFVTPYRNFSIWLQAKPTSNRATADLNMFIANHKDIKTVEYIKEQNGFYRVISYNKEVQKCQVNT